MATALDLFPRHVAMVDREGKPTAETVRAMNALFKRVGGYSGQTAGAIINTPSGNIGATTVQGAINELDAEKAATADLTAHTGDTANPHGVTKAQVGLGSVDDTADADKPISTATQTALDLKADAADLGSLASQDADAVAITGGDVLLASGSLGYAAGNGGAVVQSVSKAAGVTLDKASGEITMNAAALAANTAVTFTLTNSAIAAGDRIVINHAAGGTFGAYACDARSAAGSATVMLRNLTAGSLSEAVVLGFAVIKGATA